MEKSIFISYEGWVICLPIRSMIFWQEVKGILLRWWPNLGSVSAAPPTKGEARLPSPTTRGAAVSTPSPSASSYPTPSRRIATIIIALYPRMRSSTTFMKWKLRSHIFDYKNLWNGSKSIVLFNSYLMIWDSSTVQHAGHWLWGRTELHWTCMF